jgi:hypothetical protein
MLVAIALHTQRNSGSELNIVLIRKKGSNLCGFCACDFMVYFTSENACEQLKIEVR